MNEIEIGKALEYAKISRDAFFLIKFSGEVLADEGIMDSVISD